MAAFGDGEMDDVFKALADPSRRMLLDSLNAHNGQTLRQLCAGLDMARQSVSKHLAVLETAGLVTTVRRGREKLHYLNAAPISDIAERWISRYDQPRVEALADLKKPSSRWSASAGRMSSPASRPCWKPANPSRPSPRHNGGVEIPDHIDALRRQGGLGRLGYSAARSAGDLRW